MRGGDTSSSLSRQSSHQSHNLELAGSANFNAATSSPASGTSSAVADGTTRPEGNQATPSTLPLVLASLDSSVALLKKRLQIFEAAISTTDEDVGGDEVAAWCRFADTFLDAHRAVKQRAAARSARFPEDSATRLLNDVAQKFFEEEIGSHATHQRNGNDEEEPRNAVVGGRRDQESESLHLKPSPLPPSPLSPAPIHTSASSALLPSSDLPRTETHQTSQPHHTPNPSDALTAKRNSRRANHERSVKSGQKKNDPGKYLFERLRRVLPPLAPRALSGQQSAAHGAVGEKDSESLNLEVRNRHVSRIRLVKRSIEYLVILSERVNSREVAISSLRLKVRELRGQLGLNQEEPELAGVDLDDLDKDEEPTQSLSFYETVSSDDQTDLSKPRPPVLSLYSPPPKKCVTCGIITLEGPNCPACFSGLLYGSFKPNTLSGGGEDIVIPDTNPIDNENFRQTVSRYKAPSPPSTAGNSDASAGSYASFQSGVTPSPSGPRKLKRTRSDASASHVPAGWQLSDHFYYEGGSWKCSQQACRKRNDEATDGMRLLGVYKSPKNATRGMITRAKEHWSKHQSSAEVTSDLDVEGRSPAYFRRVSTPRNGSPAGSGSDVGTSHNVGPRFLPDFLSPLPMPPSLLSSSHPSPHLTSVANSFQSPPTTSSPIYPPPFDTSSPDEIWNADQDWTGDDFIFSPLYSPALDHGAKLYRPPEQFSNGFAAHPMPSTGAPLPSTSSSSPETRPPVGSLQHLLDQLKQIQAAHEVQIQARDGQ